MMVHASLFSGIGGPEVAAAMLGWKNAFHCEINPFGKGVLDYWFPNSESYEDITKTDFTKWYGRIDVLTGGFPCQPFPYAGKRGGREDERYLWPEMLRAIDEIRPTWVVGENVAGITTMVEGGILSELGEEASLFAEGDDILRYELIQSFTIERICSDLEHIGYSVQPMLIPAAAVGAPHRRDRVFIIAHAEDSICDGSCIGADAEQGDKRNIWDVSAGDSEWLCGEKRTTIADPIGDTGRSLPGEGRETDLSHGQEGRRIQSTVARPCREWTSTDSNSNRGCEVDEYVQSEFSDGTKSVSDGWKRNATYSDCSGREESLFTGWEEDPEETGEGVHDRTKRPCGYENPSYSEIKQYDGPKSCKPCTRPGKNEGEEPGGSYCEGVTGWDDANTVCKGLEGEDESGDSEGGERMRVRGDSPGYDWAFDAGLLPENRWRFFPTVSPVHRGNDGIPIRLDDLTISFTKWRTESLKAYGNAIVPQVMYRIFQAIEQTQQ